MTLSYEVAWAKLPASSHSPRGEAQGDVLAESAGILPARSKNGGAGTMGARIGYIGPRSADARFQVSDSPALTSLRRAGCAALLLGAWIAPRRAFRGSGAAPPAMSFLVAPRRPPGDASAVMGFSWENPGEDFRLERTLLFLLRFLKVARDRYDAAA